LIKASKVQKNLQHRSQSALATAALRINHTTKKFNLSSKWPPPWSATLSRWWGLCTDDPDDF